MRYSKFCTISYEIPQILYISMQKTSNLFVQENWNLLPICIKTLNFVYVSGRGDNRWYISHSGKLLLKVVCFIYIPAIFQIYGNVRDNLFMREEECEDPTGCVCGNQATNMNTCWTPMFFNSEVDIEKKFDCLDPIKPNGFCTEICGKYVI